VTVSRGSSNSARSTVAERASMTSSTRGKTARPAVLRRIGVMSKNSRPAASRMPGGPATGSAGGRP
jgi:hypothetical protein